MTFLRGHFTTGKIQINTNTIIFLSTWTWNWWFCGTSWWLPTRHSHRPTLRSRLPPLWFPGRGLEAEGSGSAASPAPTFSCWRARRSLSLQSLAGQSISSSFQIPSYKAASPWGSGAHCGQSTPLACTCERQQRATSALNCHHVIPWIRCAVWIKINIYRILRTIRRI